MLGVDLDGKKVDVVTLNESKLPFADRLGLAHCRLSNFIWDPLFGPKPDGFDELPDLSPASGVGFGGQKKSCKSKYDIVWPLCKTIASIIGEANVSRCHWIFLLDRTEEEWLRWYVDEQLKRTPK